MVPEGMILDLCWVSQSDGVKLDADVLVLCLDEIPGLEDFFD